MKKTVYELTERSAEIKLTHAKDIEGIFDGCTGYDPSPRIIKRYETEAEAMEALKAYKTEVRIMRWAVTFAAVTEYSVDEIEIEYDEDEDEEYTEYCGSYTTPMVEEIEWGADTYRYAPYGKRHWTRVDTEEE